MTHEVATMWIQVSREKHKDLIIGGVYRQWNKTQEADCNTILNQIQKASEENLPLLVTGDINLDMLKWEEKEYKKTSNSYSIKEVTFLSNI